MNELALFASAGGGILGGKLLGWKTVCAVEIEPYAISVLMQRQNDGILDPFPIWDDVQTFDGRPWRGIVNVVSGGFPCQDISAAKIDAKGIDGERSGLWKEFARIIGEVRPQFTFVENSPTLTARGLGRILGDLAEMGYDAQWCVMGGTALKYPIQRERIWILGVNNEFNGFGVEEIYKTADIEGFIWSTKVENNISDVKTSWLVSNGFASPEPYGMASELDEIRAIGNGQIPAVAAAAWTVLLSMYYKERQDVK